MLTGKFGNVLLIISLAVAMSFGYLVGYAANHLAVEEAIHNGEPIPHDLKQQLDRFIFINSAANKTLKEFHVLGGVVGTYVEGGTGYETYVVGFEDRYQGPRADQDFLDLIVELKRARGGDVTTVRIVQLGLDTVEVYLDGNFLAGVRPAIEIQIKA